MYSKGDVIKICCADLPIGTIFRYKFNYDGVTDSNRSDKLYIINNSNGMHALCIDNGNKAFSITNPNYIIEMEILRYGAK